MRQINRMAAVAGILAFVTAAHADTILRQRAFDLTKVSDPTTFTLYKTTVQGFGTDDEGYTKANLYFPQFRASFGRAGTTPEDWSPYNMMSIKLTNHEAFPCEFRMLVYLTSDPNNGTNGFAGKIVVNPGESKRFMCYLNPDDGMPFGLEYLRPVLSAPFANVYTSGGFRDLRTIYHWRLSYQGSLPAHVDVSDLRLIKQDLTFDNMVDQFGQYTDREWKDKIHSADDLLAQKAAEQSDFDANPPLGEKFGTDKLPVTNPVLGKWTVVTMPSGNKYFQHPNGKPLWALGVSAVHNGTPTPVGGRENYFTSLPSTTSKFSTCFYARPTLDGTNTCYSFHQQNLMLKYGDNYTTPWVNTVKQRLDSWGINMLGIQCLAPFYDNSMPYTQLLTTQNFPTRLRVPKQLWGSLPDPYDPNFQSWMVANFTKTLAPYNGQTNFMGVYVDNELSWGRTTDDKYRANVMLGILKAPATQPAKVAFVNWLSSRYKGSVSSLNTAWGTSFSAFSDILNGAWQPSTYPLNATMAKDFRDATKAYATTYFSAVRSALNQSGLTGLYLGCRYADWLPEVIEAADKYVDVHTFNVYKTSPNVNWGFLALQKKPYMFSELGFSAQADGTFGGPGEVYSQAEKAQNVLDMLNRANKEPNCVGAILYCYTDQPITGRYTDYENSGLGLVDIADTPHYDTINAIRSVAKTMYTNRG